MNPEAINLRATAFACAIGLASVCLVAGSIGLFAGPDIRLVIIIVLCGYILGERIQNYPAHLVFRIEAFFVAVVLLANIFFFGDYCCMSNMDILILLCPAF